MATLTVHLMQPPADLTNVQINRILDIPDDPRHAEVMFWFSRSFRGLYDPRLRYEAVFTCEHDAPSTAAALNWAFEEFNVGSGPAAHEYRSRRLRSLSAGDVVTVDGEAWLCTSLGWDCLDDFPVPVPSKGAPQWD